MWSYLARRILIGVLTLLIVTFLVYGLARSMPGDPILLRMQQQIDSGRRVDPESLKRQREAYGLDKPWPEGYAHWLSGVLQFNLGISIRRNIPVSQMIGDRIGPTLLLSGTSLLLSYLLAIPLGLYGTARSGKADERTLSVLLYMLYSLPAFVAALFF